MPFEVRNFEDVLEVLVASASGRFPEANVSRFSDFNKRLRVVALGLADASYNLRQAQLDVMPDTSSGEFLRRHGEIWGVPIKGATGSAGDSSYRVFGTAAAVVPVFEPMTHTPSGLLFETRSGGVIPAAGFLDVDIAALSLGVATNLEEGQELQFDSTPASLEQTGRVLVDLANGTDEEDEASYQARILDRIGRPELGGSRADFDKWVLASAAFVATAYVYPNRNGPGTVDLAALKTGRGTARLLDAGERTTVLDYVNGFRPVTATIRVLETTVEVTDVEVQVRAENDASFNFDWDDVTPPTILTYVGGTRTLTFAATRPISMAVGDRLTVDDPLSDGAEFVIEQLVASDAVILTKDLAYAPTATNPVYSGGPLVSPARDRILALFDAIGPANPDSSSYGPWEGNLRLSNLFETVQTTPGVLDSDVLDPIATVEAADPAFPGNTSVGLLIPGKILVRRWH